MTRTSATNGARIYDTCLSKAEQTPVHGDWEDTSFRLRTEHVWDGFLIVALLEDHRDRHAVLSVPHTGLQKDRFSQVVQDQNE
jgi:hypothetical protein